MANTKYDNRTRQQIAADEAKEKGLFGAIGSYLSGDFPRSESMDDPQGRLIRRQRGMETLKQREAEGKERAARLKREKERQIAKNEEARKERVRAREQAKIDRQAASVSGRALNADEKKAIADMKRRERLAQQESAQQSTGVLRSSGNQPKAPAKPKAPAAKTPASTKPASTKSTPTKSTSTTPKPTSSTPASSGPEWKKYKSVAAAKRAGSRFYTGSDGKKKLAITKEELGRKKGETLTQAYNRVEGKTSRKASSASSSSSSSANKSSNNKSTTKKNETKKVGGIRRLLLGADGKFGGARGAIDFLPGKSRPKRKEPVNKMGGGMMKSKMASKGGARGGRRPTGMKAGGPAGKFPDLTGDGKVTQADILKGRGVTKKMGGGMMKSKGMAKGGAMKKKGYAMGGPVKKKGMAKGGPVKKKAVSRKPRGVGAALRGYGKAMK